MCQSLAAEDSVLSPSVPVDVCSQMQGVKMCPSPLHCLPVLCVLPLLPVARGRAQSCYVTQAMGLLVCKRQHCCWFLGVGRCMAGSICSDLHPGAAAEPPWPCCGHLVPEEPPWCWLWLVAIARSALPALPATLQPRREPGATMVYLGGQTPPGCSSSSPLLQPKGAHPVPGCDAVLSHAQLFESLPRRWHPRLAQLGSLLGVLGAFLSLTSSSRLLQPCPLPKRATRPLC